MKLVRTGFISLFTLLAGAQSAFAQCTLNGQEIPCSEMPKWLWAIPVVFGAIGIFGFIFWLWMLIDAIKNEKGLRHKVFCYERTTAHKRLAFLMIGAARPNWLAVKPFGLHYTASQLLLCADVI
ncbi:hypothetical protein HZB04_00975 [Candidatus Wolfebacteria bacterium]|nr:hypothetical protein [Candidatus Wolfebacteria bacterium]